MRKIGIILLLFMLGNVQDFERYKEIKKYDRYFSEYSEQYFGSTFDWRYFKAQAIVESRLSPEARSPEGALGIMQILPTTFEEICQKNPGIKGSEKHPRWNIAAGIYYNRIMWETWDGDRPLQDRISFMFGAYNAGKDAILEAQQIVIQKGLDPMKWASIERVLPVVLGKDSKQTIQYVKEIHRVRELLS